MHLLNRWRHFTSSLRWFPNNLTSNDPANQSAKQILAQIEQEYDFAQFTMNSFYQWIERRYRRHICIQSFQMPAEIFGCWMRVAAHDFIFYEERTAPLHQAHIQLHELAHILCNHPIMDLSNDSTLILDALIEALESASFPIMTPMLNPILMRSRHSSQIETEAEALTELIQQRVNECQRSLELAQPIAFSRRPFIQDAYQIMEWV